MTIFQKNNSPYIYQPQPGRWPGCNKPYISTKGVWPGLVDHSRMNTVDEMRALFRGIQNGIPPARMLMAQYWESSEAGISFRLMFTMFRLSLFDAEDI